MANINGSKSSNGTDVSDEQWIVNQANLYRDSDLHAAKSWLIVGRTLFSRNFDIQVEVVTINSIYNVIVMAVIVTPWHFVFCML